MGRRRKAESLSWQKNKVAQKWACGCCSPLQGIGCRCADELSQGRCVLSRGGGAVEGADGAGWRHQEEAQDKNNTAPIHQTDISLSNCFLLIFYLGSFEWHFSNCFIYYLDISHINLNNLPNAWEGHHFFSVVMSLSAYLLTDWLTASKNATINCNISTKWKNDQPLRH